MDLTYEKLRILLDLTDVETDYLFGILQQVASASTGWTLGERRAAYDLIRKLAAPA